jgi:hypothetical protein
MNCVVWECPNNKFPCVSAQSLLRRVLGRQPERLTINEKTVVVVVAGRTSGTLFHYGH